MAALFNLSGKYVGCHQGFILDQKSVGRSTINYRVTEGLLVTIEGTDDIFHTYLKSIFVIQALYCY